MPSTPTSKGSPSTLSIQHERPGFFAPADKTAAARVGVIAEIGVNHDGQCQRAIDLTRAAALAGADAVKLQLFDPRHLLSNQARLAVYQLDQADDVFAMLDRLKLGIDAMRLVREEARRLNMAFVVTPFSLEDMNCLEQLDVDAVKIASPDAVNQPLLRMAADLGKPLIVSTGAANLDELDFLAELLRYHPAGGCLLQCVSSYPTPSSQAALGGIGVLAQRIGLPVGYSDHTTEILTGALAVAAGACVIEKHLTYSRSALGPDHAASLEPDAFARYIALIRQAALMSGPRVKSCQEVESDVRCVSRQSLCACRNLPAGHVLVREDLTVKRPGGGLPAAMLLDVLGRRLRHSVQANDLLVEDDLASDQAAA